MNKQIQAYNNTIIEINKTIIKYKTNIQKVIKLYTLLN